MHDESAGLTGPAQSDPVLPTPAPAPVGASPEEGVGTQPSVPPQAGEADQRAAQGGHVAHAVHPVSAPSGPGPGSAQPRFPAMPVSPADWLYRPPPSWWHRHRRALHLLGAVSVLALCGLTILALVRQQTGTQGLLVGLGLAVLPVPLLIATFRWIDQVEPTPWRRLGFAFAWGACAATLVALLANSLTTAWLATSVLTEHPSRAEILGTTMVAPVVEEVAKGAALVLLFLYRRRDFHGVVTGVVVAGVTATGFAFTENVLYLGNAYGQDSVIGPSALYESATAGTFFVRIVVSPFAHPLFTALTGVALGVFAALPRRRRVLRTVLPPVGLCTAALLHAVWNLAASLSGLGFLLVYVVFMLPVFAALTWLTIWSRQHDLRTVRTVLSVYAAAGWLSPSEPWALGSMRARAYARNLARRRHGSAAARTVAEYQHFAASLAMLRARAERGSPAPDFAAREQELLHHLWTRRALSAPPTASAALTLARPRVPASWVTAPGPGAEPGPGPGAGPYGR